MAKSLIEKFDEYFVRELKQARNNPEAYERASQKWEKEHDFQPFENGYDSFRRKKKRKRGY